jgi:hypothetical protein
MLLDSNRDKERYKKAYLDMLVSEKMVLGRKKEIRNKLIELINKNLTEFKTKKDSDLAIKLSDEVEEQEDPIDILNIISDISNLFKSSKKFNKDLEEIIQLVG